MSPPIESIMLDENQRLLHPEILITKIIRFKWGHKAQPDLKDRHEHQA